MPGTLMESCVSHGRGFGDWASHSPGAAREGRNWVVADMNEDGGNEHQTPLDLVVKFQPIDIVDAILWPAR